MAKINGTKIHIPTTLGINYTPIPLVTLNAERRIGLHDRADNNLNINLSYRIGESLASQLNPDNVKAIRTLAGKSFMTLLIVITI